MKEYVMVLKDKENKNKRFQVRRIARLFNDDEMYQFVELVSSFVRGGCDIKVELKERILKK